MAADAAKMGYKGPHEVTFGKKSLRISGPGSERVGFTSPRWQQALAESGVIMDDLRPVTAVKEVTKPGCERNMFTEVAHVRLEAFERDRLAHLDVSTQAICRCL